MRKEKIAYLGYFLELHSVVKDRIDFENRLQIFLSSLLEPEYSSDIDLYLMESAGLKENNGEKTLE
jgi:hypothetical protein